MLGYARVSVSERRNGTDIQTQVRDLTAAGVHPGLIYQDDGVSGITPFSRRPGWLALTAVAQIGDVVVLTDTTRLARDTLAGLAEVKSLRERRIGVRFLLGVDLTDCGPEGDFAFAVTLAAAEMQRSVTRDRIRSGQKRAKEQGVRFGRPAAMTPERDAQARAMVDAGESAKRIATAIGVSLPTLRKWWRNQQET